MAVIHKIGGEKVGFLNKSTRAQKTRVGNALEDGF